MTERRHPPSPSKLQKARLEGDLPRSPLLHKTAALSGGLLVLLWVSPELSQIFQGTSLLHWEESWPTIVQRLLISCGFVVSGAFVSALLFGSLSGGFLFSTRALFRWRASFSGLSPTWERLLSFLFLLFGCSVCALLVLRLLSLFAWAPAQSAERMLSVGSTHLIQQLFWLLGVMSVLGVLQSLTSFFQFRARHERSTQEFRQDLKDEEGQAKAFFSGKLR